MGSGTTPLKRPHTFLTGRIEVSTLSLIHICLQVGLDEIVVTNGALEALNLCLSAVCEPGDAVVVESPCFYACLQALESRGLHAIEVSTCLLYTSRCV